ncbi:MAG: response regulator transcription factor [Magnetococcales bacterium]|nr:response regulator transcription factor [Magnetococcales bacterium]
MIRIFIVDDHEVIREGLKKVLHKEKDFQVVGEAETARQAVNAISSTTVDVVLLDISLPDLDGLEVLTRLRRKEPKLPVLIFTMHDEDPLAIRYLKAGANGYLTKGGPIRTLISGIRQVAGGRNFLTPKVGDLLLEDWNINPDLPPHNALSNREFTVFRLIASGKTVGEIAGELRLTQGTISTYRKRILDKMRLRNNAEIMQYAVKNNLMKLE